MNKPKIIQKRKKIKAACSVDGTEPYRHDWPQTPVDAPNTCRSLGGEIRVGQIGVRVEESWSLELGLGLGLGLGLV